MANEGGFVSNTDGDEVGSLNGKKMQDSVQRPPTSRENKYPKTNQLEFIRTVILKSVFKHKAIKLFKEPVDPEKLQIPSYYRFIKHPMDLGTVRQRLNNQYYQNTSECLKDIAQVFCNCYVYNSPDSQIVPLAKELECLLVRRLRELPVPEEIIPEGQNLPVKVEDRRRSTGSSTTEGNDPGDESENTPIGGRLRLRQVMLKSLGRRTHVGGGKNLKMLGAEDTSSSSEQSCEEDEADDGTTGGERDGQCGSSEKKLHSSEIYILYQKAKERRTKQIKLIQEQMNNLSKQMKALQEEEQEDLKLLNRRGIKFPSTLSKRAQKERVEKSLSKKSENSNTPETKKTPGTPKTITKSVSNTPSSNSKKRPIEKVITLTSEAKKRKTETTNMLAESTASRTTSSDYDTSKPMPEKVIFELTKNLDNMDPEQRDEIIQTIFNQSDMVSDDEDGDEDVVPKVIKSLPPSCQWEIFKTAQTKLKKKEMTKASCSSKTAASPKEVKVHDADGRASASPPTQYVQPQDDLDSVDIATVDSQILPPPPVQNSALEPPEVPSPIRVSPTQERESAADNSKVARDDVDATVLVENDKENQPLQVSQPTQYNDESQLATSEVDDDDDDDLDIY